MGKRSACLEKHMDIWNVTAGQHMQLLSLVPIALLAMRWLGGELAKLQSAGVRRGGCLAAVVHRGGEHFEHILALQRVGEESSAIIYSSSCQVVPCTGFSQSKKRCRDRTHMCSVLTICWCLSIQFRDICWYLMGLR